MDRPEWMREGSREVDLASGGLARQQRQRATWTGWRAGLHRDRAGSWVQRHCKDDAEDMSAVVVLLASRSCEVCITCQTAIG